MFPCISTFTNLLVNDMYIQFFSSSYAMPLHVLGLLPHIYFAREVCLRGFLRLAAKHAEHGSHGQKYVCVSFHIVYNFI